MKKNLFTTGFLVFAMGLSAQSVLFHVDAGGIVYVGKNALVYNGGGLQMKANAVLENHGNVMVSGNGTTDVFKTIDGSNADKLESNGGGNFINKLNEPALYASHNSELSTTAPVYTYGQLYVTGITQTNISGIIDQEFRQVNHGDYQQIGLPFYGKTFTTLTTELAKPVPFNTTRYSHNEILVWNNRNVVFDNLSSINLKIGQNFKPYTYYILGGKDLDVASITRTLKGRPVSDAAASEKIVKLEDAGFNIPFGTGGNAINGYNEKYNSYLQDNFSVTAGNAWLGDFGKNYYQFGNPYLTNLDLSQIAIAETAATGDGNNLSNIYGVRLEVSGVQHSTNAGGGSSNYKAVTFSAGVPTGDLEYLMVRPLGAFAIKLTNNTLKPDFDFSTLRRFKYHPRAGSTNYSITAKRNGSTSTVKQLGIIGLDATGSEIERTYYVVADNTVSGASINVKTQVGVFGGQQFGTYEEDAINGGYDNNNVSYWLYINEANENDFKGKNIKLVNYNPNIVGFKFELREDAVLVEDNTHLLSQGEGFYIKKGSDANVAPIIQNGTISTLPGSNTGIEYDVYYGKPQNTLGSSTTVNKSSTIVVFNPELDNYFVIIDPTWKTADIQVFDMSGKLVHSASKVSSKVRYELILQKMAAGYVVHITSDKGEKVITKILR